MITINEKTVGIWYLTPIPGKQDFMGSLFRDENDILNFVYRFRYYHSDDPWDTEDTKNWYSCQAADKNVSVEKMLESVRSVVQKLSYASGQPYDETLMTEAGLEDFTQRFQEKPWAHCRPATPEEVAKFTPEEVEKAVQSVEKATKRSISFEDN